MTHLLVLGGSRFVGPPLVQALLERDCEVSILNRGTRPIAGTRQLIADRNDAVAVQSALEAAGSFDAVIDLSCFNSSQADIAWRSCVARTKRWIHLSTIAVYADTSRSPHEGSLTGSSAVWGEYGRNKDAVDVFLLAKKEISVTILRPPYIYGPGNHIDRETFLWKRALRGRPVLIPGEGKAIVQFLHVEDLTRAFLAALDHATEGAHVYNVAGDEQLSLSDYVRRLSAVCGTTNPGIPVGKAAEGYADRAYFPFDDHDCHLDTSLIKKELHWKPQYTFDEGFRKTYALYNPKTLKTSALDLTVEDAILTRLKKA